MMKKMISMILSVLICIMAVPMNIVSFAVDQTDDNFFGSGTESDPFQIRNATELALLAELINDELVDGSYKKYRNAYFIQTADIDLKNRTWTPIGAFKESEGNTNKHFFAGHYNGNYHTINNLNCDVDTNYAGLFGRIGENGQDYTEQCVISNLSVYGNVKTSGSIVGGIAGEVCCGATIKNCSFTGNISGKSEVGGIVGMTYNGGYVRSCYHNGTVTSAGSWAGGVIGSLRVGNYEFSVDAGVYDSYHTGGTVDAADGSNGGIAGRIEYADKNTDHTITFENNYYLSTSCSGGVNANSFVGCQKLPNEMWDSAAELLGSPYVLDADNINDGYPVFEWQSKPYQFKGSGTAEDPYLISSKKELEKMRDLINSEYFANKYNKCYYAQTADIDLGNELWTPIGIRLMNGEEAGLSFCGSYDGRKHNIRNLNVMRDVKFAGLFGSMNGSGTIENLVVYGKVESTGPSAGGIIGEICNGGGTVRNCAFIGDVSGNENAIGGVVGYLWLSGTIENCYHNGTVSNTGDKSVGGIVGFVTVGFDMDTDVYVKNCYHVGTVSGNEAKMGSIAGTVDDLDETKGNAYITNCFAVKGETPSVCNGNATKCEVSEVTSNMMKYAYADLGEPFVKAESDAVNNGYPVFAWQQFDYLMGDVNADGQFNIADVLWLQKWLIGEPNVKLENWKAGDYCEDGIINALDLCFMKRNLIKNRGGSQNTVGISLNETEVTLTLAGSESKLQLVATVVPDSIQEKTVIWNSSDKSVATVSDTGLVTAIGSGTAIITAKVGTGGKTATCRVTVVDPSIKLDKTNVDLYVGDSITLNALVVPAGSTVTWKSDNVRIAVVGSGKITAVAAGKATITASITVNGKDYSTFCTVNVKSVDPTGISVKTNPDKVSYYKGDTLNTTGLTLTVSYNNGTTKTVNSGFTCTPIALNTVGTQKITVSYGGQTTSFNVTVAEVQVSSISIKANPSKISYFVGDTLSTSGLVLNVKYNNGSSTTVSSGFTCSPTSLGTAGTQRITVSYGGQSTSFDVTVKTPYLTLGTVNYSQKDDHVYYSSTTGGFYAGIFDLPSATCTPSGSVSWAIASGDASINSGKVMINQPGTVVARASFSYGGKTYTKDYTYTRSVTFNAGSAFNLRSGSSTSSSSLGSIPKGTSLTVASLDYSDSKYVWGKVTYNGKTGYVALWLKNRSEQGGIITV